MIDIADGPGLDEHLKADPPNVRHPKRSRTKLGVMIDGAWTDGEHPRETGERGEFSKGR
jgi:hypothetical protein